MDNLRDSSSTQDTESKLPEGEFPESEFLVAPPSPQPQSAVERRCNSSQNNRPVQGSEHRYPTCIRNLPDHLMWSAVARTDT